MLQLCTGADTAAGCFAGKTAALVSNGGRHLVGVLWNFGVATLKGCLSFLCPGPSGVPLRAGLSVVKVLRSCASKVIITWAALVIEDRHHLVGGLSGVLGSNPGEAASTSSALGCSGVP